MMNQILLLKRALISFIFLISLLSCDILAAQTYKKGYSDGFPTVRAATGHKVFIFNPKINRWAAYNANGILVGTGRASGGKGYCPDIRRGCKTPVGTFKVASKRGADCRSTKYPVGKGGAPMPYCMFFNNNYAIHGSYDVPNHNASHGCIRVMPAAAKWLSYNFIQIGTKVIVLPY